MKRTPQSTGWTVLASALALTSVAHAQHSLPGPQLNVTPNFVPNELRDVTVDEHLGRMVPGDATFRDHTGRPVQLGQLFDGTHPVVLTLVQHNCRTLCSMVQNAAINGLREIPWTAGEQYRAITLSIDPREGADVADQRRYRTLSSYNRPAAERGWYFLTGEESQIQRVADALGYRFHYDRRTDQFAHPAVIFLLTPGGRVARYLYGIQYPPMDLRLGLFEAAEGRTVTTLERLIMYCYHYDPRAGSYVLMARRVMQIGGALIAAMLGSLLGTLWLREQIGRAHV